MGSGSDLARVAIVAIGVGLGCGGAPEENDASELARSDATVCELLPPGRLDPDRFEWQLVEQPFWKHHRVYRIQHGMPPLFSLTVAVDPEERFLRLTNDRPVRRPNIARLCFNEISQREEVSVDSGNADAYLAFFLDVHLPTRPPLLRDRGAAEHVASSPSGPRSNESLFRELSGQGPRFERRRHGEHVRATGFGWDRAGGVVYEYELVVSRAMVLGFRHDRWATQSWDYREQAGTCFGVSPDGLVLTAHHVVENAFWIGVRFLGAPEQPATVEASWPDGDLALLRIAGPLPGYLGLARDGPPERGDPLFSLALPEPLTEQTEPEVAEGEMRRRWSIDWFLTSIPVRPGYSGAPVVNGAGEAVGVMSRMQASAVEPGDRPNFGIAGMPDRVLSLVNPPVSLAQAPGPEAARLRARNALCQVQVEAHLRDSP